MLMLGVTKKEKINRMEMTENEALIFESMYNQIRMGFLSIEEIGYPSNIISVA
ncbi:MAG: hypothetical protein ACJA1N_001441, partial [Saprospiraceae bacterium]